MSDDDDFEVTVYSTPFCAPCDALKRYLTANGIPFTNKDLMMDAAAAALIEGENIRSSPVLGFDGKFYAGKALERENLTKIFDF
ncbi:MAG: glutaredoxin family protein [Alphaproteobacteria bacterium]|nr:glutaredoxin family protein [Alphaproteobacteria bacterium]